MEPRSLERGEKHIPVPRISDDMASMEPRSLERGEL